MLDHRRGESTWNHAYQSSVMAWVLELSRQAACPGLWANMRDKLQAKAAKSHQPLRHASAKNYTTQGPAQPRLRRRGCEESGKNRRYGKLKFQPRGWWPWAHCKAMRLSGQAQVVPTCIAILDCRGLSYIYIYFFFWVVWGLCLFQCTSTFLFRDCASGVCSWGLSIPKLQL